MEGYLLENEEYTPEEQLGEERLTISITEDDDAQNL